MCPGSSGIGSAPCDGRSPERMGASGAISMNPERVRLMREELYEQCRPGMATLAKHQGMSDVGTGKGLPAVPGAGRIAAGARGRKHPHG
jgi:hypothetical protein